MKGQAHFVASVLVLVALSSCTLFNSDANANTATTRLSTLVKAINAIEGVKTLLPASLQDPTSSKAKALHRTLGDVTTLDPTTLAGVRAEGYVRMQKEISESVLANIVTAFQSGLSSLESLNYDTAVSLGNVTLTKDQAAILGVPQKFDAGKALAHLDSEGVVDVKWHFAGDGHFRLPNSSETAAAGTYDYYLHLRLTSIDTTSKLTAAIAFFGTQTLTADKIDGANVYPSGTVFTVSIRGNYDAAAGSQVILFDPVTNTGLPSANQTTGRYESVTITDAETSYLAVDTDSFNAAWGDATRGGVLAKGSWTDTDTASGSSVTLSQYRSEVYGSAGELAKESVASSGLGSLFGFLTNIDDGTTTHFTNLHDYSAWTSAPPDTFSVRAYESWNDSGARTVTRLDYSTDQTTWTTFFGPSGSSHVVPWIITWRTGTSSTPWQIGDRVYFSAESDGSHLGTNGYTDYTYKLDFTYPAAGAAYGDTTGFYSKHSFPLKTLRLSTTLSDLGYVIKAQETGSSTKTAQDGTSYDAALYQFWLQKPDGTGSMRSTPTGFCPSLGDLEISHTLHQREFWSWDPDTLTRSNTQSWVVSTTVDVPPAFQLADTTLGDDISAVETALGTLATTAVTKQTEGLTQTALDAAATALGVTAIQSSDLSSYPELP